MQKFLLITTCLALTGCFKGGLDLSAPDRPQLWTAKDSASVKVVDAPTLENWWRGFKDPVLNQIVELTLAQSPDRLTAEAKILEARGLRRSSRSSLFPQIGASGNAGRQESGVDGPGSIDDFYEAGFDASFEIDIFGRNRKNFSAAGARLDSAEASYRDVTLTLIAETVRTYIDYRAAQNQYRIASKNLQSQEKTLTLIQDLNRLGSAPRLDVERTENLVNTTRASLPEFMRQAENAKLRLSVLTGGLPAALAPILQPDAEIPGADALPVLMAPAKVLSLRPDIRVAEKNLLESTKLAEAATAEFFPVFNLAGFYGIADGGLVSNANIWNVALGAAVAVLDFGKIEGRIDAARAREMQAYQQYRKAVLVAVTEVETALNDYAFINERRVSLEKAFANADNSLTLSQTLYKEGEISFLDVLDAQRNANNAESVLVSARAAQAESLTRLYKALGVY